MVSKIIDFSTLKPIDSANEGPIFIDPSVENEDTPTVSADTLTVCRGDPESSGIYAKKWEGVDQKKTSFPRLNNISSIPVSSIYDLAKALDDLAPDYRSCVIRGSLINPRNRINVRRTCRGKDPVFESRPRRWVMLDIDGIDGAIVPTDPEAAVRRIQSLIPQLLNVTVYYRVSASWGIKPGIRMHLWYWLSEAADDIRVKNYASALPISIDLSMYHPVQPHYTADPVLTQGAQDPCEGAPRGGLIRGALDELYIGPGDVTHEVTYWCDRIRDLRDSPGTARHSIINMAAYCLGRWVGSGYLDGPTVETQLIDACVESEVFDTERMVGAEDEIRRAIADGEACPREVENWKEFLIRNAEGQPKPLISNFLTIFRHHPLMRGRLGWDGRFRRTLAISALPWDTANKDLTYPRDVDTSDVLDAVDWVSRAARIPNNMRSEISKTLDRVASDTVIDDVKSYLYGLPEWDGIERAKSLFTRGCGANPSDYHYAVGKVLLISMVARALAPGCKCDTMVILQGKQGTLKSTFLKTLATGPGDRYYSECLGDIRNPFSYMSTIKGPWVIEEGELAQFGRREVESIKTFLSTTVYVGREPYESRATELKAAFVLTGTTNSACFLTDMTGNRRFLTVAVNRVDLDWLCNNREMMFAEALARYKNGEQWHLTSDMERTAAAVQAMYTSQDEWMPVIAAYLDSPPMVTGVDFDAKAPAIREHVTIAEVLTNALDIPPGRIDVRATMRCGELLANMGWAKKRTRVSGQRTYIYCRPDK